MPHWTKNASLPRPAVALAGLQMVVLGIVLGLWQIGCILAATRTAVLIGVAVFLVNERRRCAGFSVSVVVQRVADQVRKTEFPSF